MASAPERKRTNGVLRIKRAISDTSDTEEDTTAIVVNKPVHTVLPIQLERRPPISDEYLNPWLMPLRPVNEPQISISKPPEYLRPVLSFLPPPSIMCPEGFVPPTRTRNDRRRAVATMRDRLKRDGYRSFKDRTWIQCMDKLPKTLFNVEDLRDAEALERGFEFPEDDHPASPNDEPVWPLDKCPRPSRFDRYGMPSYEYMQPAHIYDALYPDGVPWLRNNQQTAGGSSRSTPTERVPVIPLESSVEHQPDPRIQRVQPTNYSPIEPDLYD